MINNQLSRGFLEVGDEVGALLGLLEPREDHLGAGDVLLGVEQVVVEGPFFPDDGHVLVRRGVGVAQGGAGLAAEEAVQVGPLFVRPAPLHRVALCALGAEDLLAAAGVAGGGLGEGCSHAVVVGGRDRLRSNRNNS